MKQREENIVALDISGTHLKLLLGSFNDTTSKTKPFFELQGMIAPAVGVSKRGVYDKDALSKAVKRIIGDLGLFCGYDIQKIHVLYTHPNIRFFRKTVGIRNIRNPEGIFITEEWLEMQKKKMRSRMEEIHRHEVCVRFETLSIVADGEEIISDPHEYTALGSLRIEYGYILMPATFMESMAESVERVTNVCRYTPTAVLGGTFLSGTQKERGIIVCDIGAEFTNITAYRDGAIIGARAVPFGGNTITDEIALLRKIAPEEAEEIKRSLSGEEPMLKKTDMRTIERKIAGHIRKEFLPYCRELGKTGLFPEGVMLTGGGAQYLNIRKIMEKTLGLYTFHLNSLYHVQSQQRADQTAWQSAYALLRDIAADEKSRMTEERNAESLWQRIMRYLHAASKIIR